MHGWPEGHKWKHLKRSVLTDLVEDRNDLLTSLSRHLHKSTLTYEEAVNAIRNSDNLEEIPPHLGDFIIAAISYTINRTIVLIKPTIEKYTDPNAIEKVRYNCKQEFLFSEDKGAGKGTDLIVLVFNGFDYYAPAQPRYIIKLTRCAANAMNFIEDATAEINSIMSSVPPSDTRTTMTKALRAMGAAKGYLAGTRLATGTTVEANLPKETTVARPVPAMEAAAKVTRKRVAATLKTLAPERKEDEGEEDWKKRKTDWKDNLTKEVNRSVRLPENQCACGESFTNKAKLDDHVTTEHPDSKAWKCSVCKKVLGSKEHCWGHVRHHLGKYYHYCDVPYKDEDDRDDEGKPKKKVCEQGFDEVSFVEFHRENTHSVGRAKIRCIFCDKPQLSKRRKTSHEKICKAKPGMKPGQKTDFCKYCDYGCRGNDTLRGHVQAEHPEKVGLPAPKRYVCKRCNKKFKTSSGARGHDCTTKKKPAAAVGKRKMLYFT